MASSSLRLSDYRRLNSGPNLLESKIRSDEEDRASQEACAFTGGFTFAGDPNWPEIRNLCSQESFQIVISGQKCGLDSNNSLVASIDRNAQVILETSPKHHACQKIVKTAVNIFLLITETGMLYFSNGASNTPLIYTSMGVIIFHGIHFLSNCIFHKVIKNATLFTSTIYPHLPLYTDKQLESKAEGNVSIEPRKESYEFSEKFYADINLDSEDFHSLFDEENFLIAVDCKKLSPVDELPVNIQVKSDFSLISEFSSKNKKRIEKTKKVFHRSLFLIESFTFLCSLNNFKESGFFI